MSAAAPLVSIVMPAYNAAPWIAEALESVRAQTEPRFEILVIDDASTDDTAAIAAAFAARDPRIRLFRQVCNGGPAAARNVGLAQAAAPWAALLDADDRYHPRRLDVLLALAERHGADMVSDNLLLCPDGAAAPSGAMFPADLLAAPRLLTAAAFIEGNVGDPRHPRVSFGFMQPMLRTAFLDAHRLRYQEANRFGEDFLLCLDCLMHGARWWITPEPLYLYRLRAGSLTEVQSADDLGRIRERERHLLDHPRLDADPDLRRALLRHKRQIDRDFHYRGVTDAVKARRPALAARRLFATHDSLSLVLRESLAQLPTIAAKAWHGGYVGSGRAGTGGRASARPRLAPAQLLAPTQPMAIRPWPRPPEGSAPATLWHAMAQVNWSEIPLVRTRGREHRSFCPRPNRHL